MTTFLSEIVWMRSFEIVNTRLLKKFTSKVSHLHFVADKAER